MLQVFRQLGIMKGMAAEQHLYRSLRRGYSFERHYAEAYKLGYRYDQTLMRDDFRLGTITQHAKSSTSYDSLEKFYRETIEPMRKQQGWTLDRTLREFNAAQEKFWEGEELNDFGRQILELYMQ